MKFSISTRWSISVKGRGTRSSAELLLW